MYIIRPSGDRPKRSIATTITAILLSYRVTVCTASSPALHQHARSDDTWLHSPVNLLSRSQCILLENLARPFGKSLKASSADSYYLEMARGRSVAAAKPRNKHVDNDKQAVWHLLGFETEASWNKWRMSELVQPRWDLYVSRLLENKAINKGRKTGSWENVFDWIKGGEENGRRKFRSAYSDPQYDNAMDWNALLLFWLVEDNRLDAQGCFYNTKLHTTEMHKLMYYFIICAKGHHGRMKASKSQKQCVTSDATSSRTTATNERPPISTEDLDPEKGLCLIRWVEGIPHALLRDLAFPLLVQLQGFCGTSKSVFRQYVEEAFELKKHRQRIVLFYAEDGLSYEESQVQAHGNQTAVLFMLETATSELDIDANLEDPPIPNGPDENAEDEIDT